MSDTATGTAVPEKVVAENTETNMETAEPVAASKPEGESEAKPTDTNDNTAPSGETKEEKSKENRRENGRSDGNDRSNWRGHGRGGRGRRDDDRSERERKRKAKEEEFAKLPVTDDPVMIRQQVEFYFSDANLLTDEHLFKELQGDKNRPVPIKHVHTFTRMRRFQPYSAVVNALRESPVLEVVDTDRYSGEGNEGVRRKTPIKLITFEDDEGQHISLDEHFQRLKRRSLNNLDSSVYVKNFGNPDEAGQIELENFFRPYGAIMVRKRRDDSDNWKGSVFVEFENEDMQKQFLALDPKPQYKGNDLVIMGKREYSKMKCDEKGIVPNWERDPTGKNTRTFNRDHNDRDRRGGRGGGGRGRGGRGRGGRGRGNDRGDRDRKDWNGRRDDFQKSRDFKDSGNKRKADSDSAEREETKKAKVEIKEDA